MLVAKRAFWMRVEIVNGENLINISPTPERPIGWYGETDSLWFMDFRLGDKLSMSVNAVDDAADDVLLNMFPDALMKDSE